MDIVVENKFIKKYGMNAVLEPFVTDVGKLVSAVCMYFCATITINVKTLQEEGFTFQVLGCPQKLYGTVAAIAADNHRTSLMDHMPSKLLSCLRHVISVIIIRVKL